MVLLFNFLMKKLICFDLDNTLIHSDVAHTLAYNHALKNNNFKKQNPKIMKKLYGKPHHEIIKILTKGKANKKQTEKIYHEHQKYLVQLYSKHAKAIPGALTTLKKLKKEYILAILSNSTTKNIKALLKATKIPQNLFRIIIGPDKVKKPKPQPDEIYKAEHLTKHKALVMVGDSIYDIKSARKAKTIGIAVLTGHYTKAKIAKEKPYIIIKNLKELPQVLNNLNKK